LTLALLFSCTPKKSYYTVEDFESVPKIDAHFHYLTMDTTCIDFASGINFSLISPNWDGEVAIDTQLYITSNLHKINKDKLAFFGTFSVDGFGSDNFGDRIIAQIDECMKAGASGIKIWKNIGMVLQDSTGRFIMIDDPAFEPVFQYLESNEIPVLAHLGEPKDCWLPVEEMKDPSNVYYYKNHPQYYMYMHPEVPSYDEQIRARDNILEKYPSLDFIGAHLGSLEWSIDELALRFDKYPNLKVDMAARMYPLKYQSKSDREKVRNFMIKYQDRILYGTDNSIYDRPGADVNDQMENLKKGWISQWVYLVSDSTTDVQGLKLPKEVIDKIYFKNAAIYF
jgi:predicted TIM-barrel fold metal-dependent hydrolase